jgi:hypothetical protein
MNTHIAGHGMPVFKGTPVQIYPHSVGRGLGGALSSLLRSTNFPVHLIKPTVGRFTKHLVNTGAAKLNEIIDKKLILPNSAPPGPPKASVKRRARPVKRTKKRYKADLFS